MTNPFSNPEQRKILLGIGAGIGLVAWMAFFFVPQCGKWAAGYSKVTELRRKISETHQGLSQLSGVEQALARLRAQYELPAVTPPPEEQLPELLEMIAQTARSSQVSLLSVKPKENLSQLSAGPTGYLELPIQLEASAGYHQIGKFLDLLEHSESLVRVQKLKIQSNPDDLWKHQATLILQAYLLPGGNSKKLK